MVLADGVGPGAEDTVKVSGEDIIVKETKTAAGDRYVYFSLEMESLLRSSSGSAPGRRRRMMGGNWRTLTTSSAVMETGSP